MKALKTLPKTLEETYDRIFTTIPEEERMFVHLVLRWIAHHNELSDGDGMPCDVLIQAVVASTAELTGEQNARYYDKDTLREICGCLVDISLKDTYMNKPCPKYSAVTFAHYTVREYLDSGRISKSAFTQRYTVEGNWTERFIKITLSEAQNVQTKGSLGVALSHRKSNIIGAIGSDLTAFCITFGINTLYRWPEHICRRDILEKLAFDLVDPSKPHYETMITVSKALKYSRLFFATSLSRRLRMFKWHLETSTEAKHLWNLLFLYHEHKGYSSLVESFLRKDRCYLQNRLLFECHMRPFFTYHEFTLVPVLVDGSFFEVFAQLYGVFPDVLPYLMELGAEMFDPSVALLLSIGSHRHDSVRENFCLVQQLLQSGADPNLKGYLVTPLQIAVYCLDFEAVNKLLIHGAHPNSTGCERGVAWKEKTIMSQINHLHGASPLCIVRKYTSFNLFNRHHLGFIEERLKKLEALLLQHGAKEISTTSTADFDEAHHA